MTQKFRSHCMDKCVYLGPYYVYSREFRSQRYDIFLHRFSLDMEGGSRRDKFIFRYSDYGGYEYMYKVTAFGSVDHTLVGMFEAAMLRAKVKGLLKASVLRDWESQR